MATQGHSAPSASNTESPTTGLATSTAVQTETNPQPGYLARALNGVVFLQWTRTGDSVAGSLTEAFTNSGDVTKVDHTNGTVSGIISGSSVALTVSSGPLSNPVSWNGTLNGSRLTLSFPNTDGTLNTQYFQPSTIGDYNTAVNKLLGTAADALAQQADARATFAAMDAASTQATQSADTASTQAAQAIEQETQTVIDNAPLYEVVCPGSDSGGYCEHLGARGTVTEAQTVGGDLHIGGGHNNIGDGSVSYTVAAVSADGSLHTITSSTDSLTDGADTISLDSLFNGDINGVKLGTYRIALSIGGHTLAPYTVTVLP
jgi:hypothetical protein